eukprot:11610241-Alexandrium_andersonii.AAC.1
MAHSCRAAVPSRAEPGRARASRRHVCRAGQARRGGACVRGHADAFAAARQVASNRSAVRWLELQAAAEAELATDAQLDGLRGAQRANARGPT